MLFNSYVFILYFLPIFLIGYFSLNYFKFHKCAMLFVVATSLWFYGYADIRFIPLLGISIVVNYAVYAYMVHKNQKKAKLVLAIVGVIFNLGLLVYFKYSGFILDNINMVAGTDFVLQNIVLPLGISYFTFQQISFIVDAYKGGIKEKYDFLYYVTYMTFFPKLSQGPISMHDEIIPQFMDKEKRYLNWDNLACGIYAFVLGLIKKMLFADSFGKVADWGYANVASLDTVNGIIVMLSYTLQIYFDFSGYCDMAVGIAKMINIDLPINFDSPYKALTIRDFWRTWHITLNKFFTKYVYIPLGGSKKGALRTCVNTMIVFTLSGLWHGPSWNYVIWGMGHGLMLVVYRTFQKFFDKLHPVLNWGITFGFVNVMWVFFRTNMKDAVLLLKSVFLMDIAPVAKEITDMFWIEDYGPIVKWFQLQDISQIYPQFGMVGMFVMALLIIMGTDNTITKMKRFATTTRKSVFVMVGCAFLLVWCLFGMSGITTFIYNGF